MIFLIAIEIEEFYIHYSHPLAELQYRVLASPLSPRWVIYNDQKVCASEKPPKDLGYIYFYQRIPS